MKTEGEWPFDQPRNCAIYTIRQVIENEVPILVVYHDADDHGWQFLSNIETKADDAKIVSLESITRIDPSVFQVATIPPGFHAWRASVTSDWTIAETPKEEEN
jgi:hypothetical protein